MRTRLSGIILALTVTTLCQVVSAQDFLGGSISFSTSHNLTRDDEVTNTTSISLSPDFGWFIGDQWAIGIKPAVGFAKFSSNDTKNLNVGISPYARYRILDYKRFSLWAEGYLGLRYINSSNGSGLANHAISYGIGVKPIITYNLNEHVCLFGSVNLFSLSLQGYSSYYSATDKWFNSISFGLSGQTDDVIDPLSEISIGFYYKF